MSFCISPMSNHASSGNSSRSAARAFSIGEPIGLCGHDVDGKLGGRFRRVRRAADPSANASICTARLMLIASLSTRPCPFSPTCVGVPELAEDRLGARVGVLVAADHDRQRSGLHLGDAPRHRRVQHDAPCARTRSASSRLARGLTVLMSTQISSAARPARMPSGPDATVSSTSSSGTDVKTIPAASATSRGVSHHCRPSWTSPSRVRAASLLAVDGVAGGEESGCHVAAHVSQADEADLVVAAVLVAISRPPSVGRRVVCIAAPPSREPYRADNRHWGHGLRVSGMRSPGRGGTIRTWPK